MQRLHRVQRQFNPEGVNCQSDTLGCRAGIASAPYAASASVGMSNAVASLVRKRVPYVSGLELEMRKVYQM